MVSEVDDKLKLRNALCIDYTGDVKAFKQFPAFGDDVIRLLRAGAENKTVVIVDRGFGFEKRAPHVVRDHLNLTGDNPLVGPNDPVGARFPVLLDVYITGFLTDMAEGVAAGIKPGVQVSEPEMDMIRLLGGDFACYNLVPTMIVAGHAGWKVLAFVVPEGSYAELIPSLEFVLGRALEEDQ